VRGFHSFRLYSPDPSRQIVVPVVSTSTQL
jgi:hypothetical protein